MMRRTTFSEARTGSSSSRRRAVTKRYPRAPSPSSVKILRTSARRGARRSGLAIARRWYS